MCVTAVACLVSAVDSWTAQSAAQTAPAGDVIGVGNFTHIVRNLDTFIEFYRDVIGLELTAPARPFANDAAILTLANAPGAQYRFVSLTIPGSPFGVEAVEYKDIERTPVVPRLQDPGAATLTLQVRDMDAIVGRLNKAGARNNLFLELIQTAQ